jgi:NNP family nitrate/nitrite transporter-like MFS transporter
LFLVPIVITLSLFGAWSGGPQTVHWLGESHPMWLQNAGFVWIPLILLLPAIGIGIAVQYPETPYGMLLLLAALCGFGGASFASSMTFLSVLFPRWEVGNALSLNSGLGNLGVSLALFLVPIVITLSLFGAWSGDPQTVHWLGESHPMWLQNAGFVWIPLILLCALLARYGMYMVPMPKTPSRGARIFAQRQYWVLALLYLGTFGSFIGFTAAFPLLLAIQFRGVDVLQYVFLGPLLGALARPLGGWLADRHGGGRVTLFAFVTMAVALLLCLASLPSPAQTGSFPGVMIAFALLFAATGMGSGSMFFMVPGLDNRDTPVPLARRSVRVVGQAVGMVSAVGALGAVAVPMVLALALAVSGGVHAAFLVFLLFYLGCMVLTRCCDVRMRAEGPR